jgi:Domain of unknown function (DUF4387)
MHDTGLHGRVEPGRADRVGQSLQAVAADDQRVRDPAVAELGEHGHPLLGAALIGYQTIIISGMRNPAVLARIDEWCDTVLHHLHHTIPTTIGVEPGQYDIQLLRYGHDAVLGAAEPHRRQPPREVGIVFVATAPDQATATQLAKLANPVLVHAPLSGEQAMPSYAFLGSPAEIERGPVHEFVVQHAVDVDTPNELVAGPFWVTIDIFFADAATYERAAASLALTDVEAIAQRYNVSPGTVKVFRLPDLHAIKLSFPRSNAQRGAHDRDMHAGQQYVPLLDIDTRKPQPRTAVGAIAVPVGHARERLGPGVILG